jgi:hypothetical protein
MGAANLPAIASRHGLAFLRMLREECALFQGKGSANCWWSGFKVDTVYDPKLGYGFSLIREGRPAVRVWGFVDDFLIHGATYGDTRDALVAFMDAACRVGFLCHPEKCTPPCQEVVYVGFQFNTVGCPRLSVPLEKRERALAIVEHIRHSPERQEYSRLSLAVASGVLQSLVDATPSRLGNTYLRQFHSLVRPEGLGTGVLPYYTKTRVTSEVRRDLLWWGRFLEFIAGRYAYTLRSFTLVPNWGDGSGTGAGGTLGLPDRPLKMWQGKWSPHVFKFSLNFKELGTLLLTLQELLKIGPSEVRGTTIFYFTDNTTIYWIALRSASKHPRLHALIEQIRLLEIQLGCQLQVVHVPGVVMIEQGTEGLSRGVWCSPFQDLTDQATLTAAVFAPLTVDFDLVKEYVATYALSTR